MFQAYDTFGQVLSRDVPSKLKGQDIVGMSNV